MYLTKNCLSFLNHRSVIIFKLLSIAKIANIFELLTRIGKQFYYSLSFYFIMVYVNNSAIHFLTFLVLSIFLLTFIESMLENLNDVVCLSFLSNEEDTVIFYDNDNDTIENFIYFSVMEDKP